MPNLHPAWPSGWGKALASRLLRCVELMGTLMNLYLFNIRSLLRHQMLRWWAATMARLCTKCLCRENFSSCQQIWNSSSSKEVSGVGCRFTARTDKELTVPFGLTQSWPLTLYEISLSPIFCCVSLSQSIAFLVFVFPQSRMKQIQDPRETFRCESKKRHHWHYLWSGIPASSCLLYPGGTHIIYVVCMKFKWYEGLGKNDYSRIHLPHRAGRLLRRHNSSLLSNLYLGCRINHETWDT